MNPTLQPHAALRAVRFGGPTCALVSALLLLAACGSDDDASGENGGAGGGGAAGASGGGGGGGIGGVSAGSGGGSAGTGSGGRAGGGGSGTAGSGGSGTAGSSAGGSSSSEADGFDCEAPPVHEACDAGQLCCAGTPPDGTTMCVAAGTECGACQGDFCGTVKCDGPEDCGGKPCCSHNTVVDMDDCPAAGPCPRVTFVVECADTCEAPAFQLCHGFECPDGMTCELNPLGPPFLSYCE